MQHLAIADWDLQEKALFSELSKNTRLAYQKGWNKFVEYCHTKGIADPLSASPDDIARFLVRLATRPSPQSGVLLSIGTVTLYKSAVNKRYVEAGKKPPTIHPVVRSTLRGLKRLKGHPNRRVEALREYQIEAMLQACPNTVIGRRDAAIIAVGFAAALRRSEICNLLVDDVELLDTTEHRGKCMRLTIRQSKTDQEGNGQQVPIIDGNVVRPITRLKLWLEYSGITSGPLFQTMKRGGYLRGKPMHHSDIPRIVKQYAQSAGMNPSNLSGHSLRAGFVTSAAVHHARLDKIMAVTRHRSPATVMGYIRDADAFADHAGQNFL